MSSSRPCTGDGADSSGSGDVEKGKEKREEEREIERCEREGKSLSERAVRPSMMTPTR